ncbi:exosome nuclease subunit [Tilletia horrida]|nr:exosome nuclease subunit [Tilletia horrida]
MASSSRQKLDAGAGAGAGASPAQDVSGYLHAVQHALVPLTRTASQLPSASDLEFHRSLNPGLAATLDAHSHALVGIVNGLTSWIDPDSASATALTSASLQASLGGTVPRAIGDLVDSLLERADINLDEYEGKREPRPSAFTVVKGKDKQQKGAEQQQAQQLQLQNANGKGKAKQTTASPLPASILNALIKKPQRLFTTKPDNRSNIPWSRPLKFGKPHAAVPLAQAGANRPGGPDPQQIWKKPKTRQGMFCSEGDPEDNYYYTEILNATLPAHALEERTPVRTEPLNPEAPEAPTDAGPFTWVDTAEGIHALAAHLNEDRVTEIAIDLEHTSYRSFMGLTCLMQISTRWGDWIVDTLADAVRETAERLNEALADPRKIKVLHGADHDILWMQRDLGLYVVGLFDTYQAAVILDYPMKGLAYLLERFCAFNADKRYQLADWRIRPLPKEMLYYAREDTHDLLYIYDCLRTELRTKTEDRTGAITAVFQRSKATAARTYAKDVWDEEGLSREGWKSLVVRYGHLNPTPNAQRQHWLVRALHRWRDEVARKEDESPKYVLSAQHLLSLASKAPRSPQETLNLIKAGPRELKARLGELTKLIVDEIEAFEKHARDQAEALKIAAMGGAKTQDKMEESSDEGEEEEEDEEEEAGEKVQRPDEVEDVDMFGIDAPAAASASAALSAASAASVSVRTAPPIEDVSTTLASSPQVASLSLWTGPPPASTSSSAATQEPMSAAASAPAVKPKRSLFSLPAGFSGKHLFGGGKAAAPPAPAPASTLASASNKQAADASRPAPQSTLFGALAGPASDKSGARAHGASASTEKASVIRAGLAAAVGGLLSGGRLSSSSLSRAAAGADSGDYETAEDNAASQQQQAAFGSAPSAPAPAIKMASGRTLSSVTQKLLSRGFYNGNASTTPVGTDTAAEPTSKQETRGEDPDLSAFGDLVQLKKRKEKTKGKKRGLDEVVESGPDEGTGVVGGAKKARTSESGSVVEGKKGGGFLKPFDLAKDASILDLPAPSSSSSTGGVAAPPGKANKRDGGGKKTKGGGSGGGQGPSSSSNNGFGPAPRKRNELSSGNRSGTFR